MPGFSLAALPARNDVDSALILRNCRRAMAKHGRVLVVERRIPEHDGDAVPALLSDINMLVITGGRERTDAEFARGAISASFLSPLTGE